jgi:hypothetical protein
VPEAIPRYLLASPEDGDPPFGRHLSGLEPLIPVRSVSDLLGEEGGAAGEARIPGWVILSHGTEPSTIARLLVRLAEAEGEWIVLLLVGEGDEPDVIPLSTGVRIPLAAVAARIVGREAGGGAFSLRRVLRELARIRHDINNALTTAFAEAHLLRLDAPEGSESAESLRELEAQLRRIRDLVGELSAIRVGGGR